MIKTVAFDADDTLWVNETIFTDTRLEFERILGSYFEITDSLEQELYEVERKNLKLFGYGIKGFMLSMIESALQLTHYKITGKDIESIIQLGKAMLVHPVHLMPGIEQLLDTLKNDYQLMIITKGDLWDQESKVARSGLADYFDLVEIVSEKNVETYAEVLSRNRIDIEVFTMIGNSLKSDILPICELGGKAIHIPFHDTWTHEQMDSNNVHHDYLELKELHEVGAALANIRP